MIGVTASVAAQRPDFSGMWTLDPAVSEVMVNGPGPVFIERSGRLEATDIRLDDFDLFMLRGLTRLDLEFTATR